MPLESLEASVSRLNASLGAKALPSDALRAIAGAADLDITLERAAAHSQPIPREKEERYQMFTTLANAFWTTVKDIPVAVTRASGEQSATVKAGETERMLTGRIDDHGSADLASIMYAVSNAYAREMKETRDEVEPVAADAEAFRYNVDRILSGSQEGYQIVMNMVSSLLKARAEKSATPLSPTDLNKNIDGFAPHLKKIMKANIVADEFLDALMYGGVHLFACEERDGHANEYDFAFRPELVSMMEEIGERLCLDQEGQPLDLAQLFNDIHECLTRHLGSENMHADTELMNNIFAQNVQSIGQRLYDQTGDEPDGIKILQEIEAGLFADMNAKPLAEWHPVMRELCMTALFLKSVVGWHAEPNIRNVSGCPMLYSRQFVPWLKKGSEPVKDWYAKTIGAQQQ